jgi:hypothetical protein
MFAQNIGSLPIQKSLNPFAGEVFSFRIVTAVSGKQLREISNFVINLL